MLRKCEYNISDENIDKFTNKMIDNDMGASICPFNMRQ